MQICQHLPNIPLLYRLSAGLEISRSFKYIRRRLLCHLDVLTVPQPNIGQRGDASE